MFWQITAYLYHVYDSTYLSTIKVALGGMFIGSGDCITTVDCIWYQCWLNRLPLSLGDGAPMIINNKYTTALRFIMLSICCVGTLILYSVKCWWKMHQKFKLLTTHFCQSYPILQSKLAHSCLLALFSNPYWVSVLYCSVATFWLTCYIKLVKYQLFIYISFIYLHFRFVL